MNLFTCDFGRYGDETVSNEISRRYRVTDDGTIIWLGHPFETDEKRGLKNSGRQSDIIKIDRTLICPPKAKLFHKEGSVTLRSCSLHRDGNCVCLSPCRDQQEDVALVLLRVSGRTVNLPQSPNLIAQGSVIETASCTPSRYPQRHALDATEERLIVLKPGESYDFELEHSAPRIFGVSVHKGRRRTMRVTYLYGELSVSEVTVAPLAVPTFTGEDFQLDIGGLGVFIFFGLIEGVACTHSTAGTLKGGLIGVGLYAVICLIRLVVHLLLTPRYHSQKGLE